MLHDVQFFFNLLKNIFFFSKSNFCKSVGFFPKLGSELHLKAPTEEETKAVLLTNEGSSVRSGAHTSLAICEVLATCEITRGEGQQRPQ